MGIDRPKRAKLQLRSGRHHHHALGGDQQPVAVLAEDPAEPLESGLENDDPDHLARPGVNRTCRVQPALSGSHADGEVGIDLSIDGRLEVGTELVVFSDEAVRRIPVGRGDRLPPSVENIADSRSVHALEPVQALIDRTGRPRLGRGEQNLDVRIAGEHASGGFRLPDMDGDMLGHVGGQIVAPGPEGLFGAMAEVIGQQPTGGNDNRQHADGRADQARLAPETHADPSPTGGPDHGSQRHRRHDGHSRYSAEDQPLPTAGACRRVDEQRHSGDDCPCSFGPGNPSPRQQRRGEPQHAGREDDSRSHSPEEAGQSAGDYDQHHRHRQGDQPSGQVDSGVGSEHISRCLPDHQKRRCGDATAKNCQPWRVAHPCAGHQQPLPGGHAGREKGQQNPRPSSRGAFPQMQTGIGQEHRQQAMNHGEKVEM